MSSNGVGVAMSESEQRRGLVPRLRFPEFRDAGAWSTEKVSELTTSITPPKKLSTSLYGAAGNFPVIDQSQSLICGWTNDLDAIINMGVPLIVFGDHTCVLKYVNFPFAQGADGIKVLKAKPRVVIEYLYQSLLHKPVATVDYRRHFAILKERIVDLPDIKSGEQQKIAACLSSLDEVIAAEGERLALLRTHKKGLLQTLFPALGQTTPCLRFPEFRHAGGWEEKPLGKICDIAQGFGFPDRMQGKSSGEYPFCKVSDISRAVNENGGLLDTATNYVDHADLKILAAKSIPAGATVFAKIGEALRLNRRAIAGAVCLIDNNAVALKAKDGATAPYFLFSLSQTIDMNDYCGGAVPSVNKSTLEAIVVQAPGLAEQTKIAGCFQSIDSVIASQLERIHALKAHKSGLMQQLFSRPAEVSA